MVDTIDYAYVRRTAKKLWAIKQKGCNCNFCAKNLFDTFWEAEFHHLDPTVKEYGLASAFEKRSFEEAKEELSKCVLVCSGCHRKLHKNIDKFEQLKPQILNQLSLYENDTNKKRGKVTEEAINKIVELYNSGKQFSEISNEVNLNEATIIKQLIKLGLTKPNRKRCRMESSAFDEQFIELWNKKLPNWEIGELMGGFTPDAVRSKSKQLIALGKIEYRKPIPHPPQKPSPAVPPKDQS